jgi:hypothetical protein
LTVTVPAALLLAVVVFLLCKYAGLKLWHAAVCIILGFYLASTSFAPYISQFTESVRAAERRKGQHMSVSIGCPVRDSRTGHRRGRL